MGRGVLRLCHIPDPNSITRALHRNAPVWRKNYARISSCSIQEVLEDFFSWLKFVLRGLQTYVQSFGKIFSPVSDFWTSRQIDTTWAKVWEGLIGLIRLNLRNITSKIWRRPLNYKTIACYTHCAFHLIYVRKTCWNSNSTEEVLYKKE